MFHKYEVVSGTETEMLRRRLLTGSETAGPGRTQRHNRFRSGRGLQVVKQDSNSGSDLLQQ